MVARLTFNLLSAVNVHDEFLVSRLHWMTPALNITLAASCFMDMILFWFPKGQPHTPTQTFSVKKKWSHLINQHNTDP